MEGCGLCVIFLFPKKIRATNLVDRLRGSSQKDGGWGWGEILKAGWELVNDRVRPRG